MSLSTRTALFDFMQTNDKKGRAALIRSKDSFFDQLYRQQFGAVNEYEYQCRFDKRPSHPHIIDFFMFSSNQI